MNTRSLVRYDVVERFEKTLQPAPLPTNRWLVAQISNLLYRGFVIRKPFKIAGAPGVGHALPNAIRRYSRLQICATPPARRSRFRDSRREKYFRAMHFIPLAVFDIAPLRASQCAHLASWRLFRKRSAKVADVFCDSPQHAAARKGERSA